MISAQGSAVHWQVAMSCHLIGVSLSLYLPSCVSLASGSLASQTMY